VGFCDELGRNAHLGTFVAPSCAEKQLALIQEESTSHLLRGSTAWIAEGLAIQESQYVHQYHVKTPIE
jgi:hypothetical protein